MLRCALLGPNRNPVYAAAWAELAAIDGVEIVLATDGRVSPDMVASVRTDVLISAGYHHMIGSKTRAAARIAAVGLHPSLLPAYRGSYPLWWALRNNEPEAGLSLYVLDQGIDTGPIISQARVDIHAGDTFGRLYARVAGQVPGLIRPYVSALMEGATVHAEPQDESKASVYRTPNAFLRSWMKARWTIRSALKG